MRVCLTMATYLGSRGGHRGRHRGRLGGGHRGGLRGRLRLRLRLRLRRGLRPRLRLSDVRLQRVVLRGVRVEAGGTCAAVVDKHDVGAPAAAVRTAW